MVLIDTALRQREASGRPIKVGMVGAGFMGKGIALQICKYTRGIRLVAISNRNLTKAENAYESAGISMYKHVKSLGELNDCIRSNKYAVTEDAMLLCKAENIDLILDVTGTVEFGARVALTSIENGKHIILMNAELDSTIGPILKRYADQAGVIYSNTDGDQPGVQMNLYRFLMNLGFKPVLCGNIKGLQDRYRNPDTQRSYAEQWGQNVYKVTSFADGTKISFEQSVVANGTGMRVGQRGMFGPVVDAGTPVEESINHYPVEILIHGSGIVDYIVGPSPSPGIFILAIHDDPEQRKLLNLYKLGSGPLYCFCTPFHLCHFEVPNTIARAVIFNDPAIAPLGAPKVDVITAAKRDLRKGEMLDGIGHFMTYGLCENYDISVRENLLPMGLTEGCILKRDILNDQVISYRDVVLPDDRLADRIRKEQTLLFFPNSI